MSNRPRRRLLRQWRMHATVLWVDDSPPDSIQTMEEWNRWHRDAFRFLWREPLRFPNNIRPDAGLINIQCRNQAALFNPLSDPMPDRPEHLREFGNRNDPLFLWQKTEEAISDALEYLEPARRISRPGFDWTAWAWWRNHARPELPGYQPEKDPAADWLHFFEDYPARFYLGLKKLRTGFTAVDQYGSRRNPWFQDHGSAARNILNLDKRITKSWPCRPLKLITEPELHALLCLAACWWALDDLLGLSEDPEQWPRSELDYIAGLIQDAERWLAEAYRLKQADAREATVRAEEDAKQAAIQEKADKEKADIQANADLEMAAIQARADAEKAAIRDAWAADSHREKSAKGGKAPKGSEGVRLLALALREEKTSASATALFLAALSRCGSKDSAVLADLRRLAGGHTITANTEAQLVSTGPDGEPDGLPVGLAGWRKILRRKR